MGDRAWLVDQALNSLGVPDLSLEWAASGNTLHLTVRQAEPVLRVRVPVVIRFEGGDEVTEVVDASSAQMKRASAVDGVVVAAELDPDFRILRWTPEYRAEGTAILPYTRGDIALNYGRND